MEHKKGEEQVQVTGTIPDALQTKRTQTDPRILSLTSPILPGVEINSERHIFSRIFRGDEQKMGEFPDGLGMGRNEFLELRSEVGEPRSGRKPHIWHLSGQDFPRLSLYQLVNRT